MPSFLLSSAFLVYLLYLCDISNVYIYFALTILRWTQNDNQTHSSSTICCLQLLPNLAFIINRYCVLREWETNTEKALGYIHTKILEILIQLMSRRNVAVLAGEPVAWVPGHGQLQCRQGLQDLPLRQTAEGLVQAAGAQGDLHALPPGGKRCWRRSCCLQHTRTIYNWPYCAGLTLAWAL